MRASANTRTKHTQTGPVFNGAHIKKSAGDCDSSSERKYNLKYLHQRRGPGVCVIRSRCVLGRKVEIDIPCRFLCCDYDEASSCETTGNTGDKLANFEAEFIRNLPILGYDLRD